MGSNVDVIHVHSDDNWETRFIPWIEEMERAGVGKRDGVFVVNITLAIFYFCFSIDLLLRIPDLYFFFLQYVSGNF